MPEARHVAEHMARCEGGGEREDRAVLPKI